MADILDFNRSRVERRPKEAPSGPAEVVIFPGVRIERHEFSLADRVGACRTRPAPGRYLAAEE